MVSWQKNKEASDWQTYLVYQLEACFLGGKPLKLMCWLRSQKKLTLVFFQAVVAWMNEVMYDQNIIMTMPVYLFEIQSNKYN